MRPRGESFLSWVLTHGDCDGVCSGAIALAARWPSKIVFTKPSTLLDDLIGLRDIERIIICDIALPETKARDILATLQELSSKHELLYIDHHPLPFNFDMPGFFVHSLNACASELTYRAFQVQLPKDMSRVAIYGAIGDYADDSEFMQLIISYWDKRMLYFESGLLSQGLDYIRRDYRSKRRILESLAMNLLPSSDAELAGAAIEESRLEERMRKEVTVKVRTLGKIAYVLNIEGSIGKAAIYARAVTGLQIGIAGEEERGYVDMSLRSVREGLDLDRILRRLAPSFGGTGGGHPKAAGASIPVESFQLFVKALDELT